MGNVPGPDGGIYWCDATHAAYGGHTVHCGGLKGHQGVHVARRVTDRYGQPVTLAGFSAVRWADGADLTTIRGRARSLAALAIFGEAR